MWYARKFLRRFPSWLHGVWVASFLFFLIGGGLNALVISLNDHMPVPTAAEDFYVVYPNYYSVALEIRPDRMLIEGKVPRYAVMTSETKLPALADRFYLVTPVNIWRSLPLWLTIQCVRSDIPILGQEMQASIGDIANWVGDVLVLLAALLTIAFMFFQNLSQYLRKAVGKQNVRALTRSN